MEQASRCIKSQREAARLPFSRRFRDSFYHSCISLLRKRKAANRVGYFSEARKNCSEVLELKLKQLICLGGLLEMAIIQALPFNSCPLQLQVGKWGPERGGREGEGGSLDSSNKGLHVSFPPSLQNWPRSQASLQGDHRLGWPLHIRGGYKTKSSSCWGNLAHFLCRDSHENKRCSLV